jgi:hypothetical protein
MTFVINHVYRLNTLPLSLPEPRESVNEHVKLKLRYIGPFSLPKRYEYLPNWCVSSVSK